MSFPHRFIRIVSAVLAVIILLELSPLAHASAPAAEGALARAALASVAAQLQSDLKLLRTQGKEAFLDALFTRLTADEARAHDLVVRAVKSSGPRPLGNRILALGSTILADVLAVVPESWQESIVINTLDRFVTKVTRQLRGLLSGQSTAELDLGLRSLLRLVNDHNFAAGQMVTGDSWWEQFFGNSTVVRNFLIVIVTLASIGVAVGLAIAGSTTAPVVAVIGALVALIALMNR